MKTNRSLLVAAALCFTAAAATFAASAHMGTWKLNEAKSKFAPGATKNTTVTYTAAKDDMIKLTVHGVDKDGKTVHWTWTGKFDGQPYKVEGNAAVDTFAVKMVNDHTNDTTGHEGWQSGNDGRDHRGGRREIAHRHDHNDERRWEKADRHSLLRQGVEVGCELATRNGRRFTTAI